MASGSDAIEAWLASALLTGSIQGGLAVLIVWLLCRRSARMPASVQAAVWWLAALKLLLAFVPVPAISLPVLPAPEPATAGVIAVAPDTLSAVVTHSGASPSGVSWIAVVIAVWLAGVLLQIVRLLLAYRDLQRIVRTSVGIAESESAVVSGCARALGLDRIPPVRLSQHIRAPLVAGIHRPVVLVPAGAPFASEDLRMMLCHELMHVRRRDLLLGWVPAVAERLFFFHPLARLAAREYVTAREAACDAAVVRALGVAPDAYGRLLMRLGIGRSNQALAAGGAPESMSSLRRRLDMLQGPPITRNSRHLAWSLVVVAIVAMIPFQLAAKASPARPPQVPAETRTAPAPAPPAIPREAAPSQEAADDTSTRKANRNIYVANADGSHQRVVTAAEAENWSAYVRETQDSLRVLAQETENARAQEGAKTDTEAFLRAQIAALQARLRRMAESELQARANASEQAARRRLLDAETTVAAAEQRIAEAQIRDRNELLTVQLNALREQQQALMRQMEQIAEQQKALADMQRRMAAEIEQRLREALKSR